MKKLRAYSVKEEPGAEWHIVVIAESAKRAKAVGYDYIKGNFNIDSVYTDFRVIWLKGAKVPDYLPNEYVFESCNGHICFCDYWTGCEEIHCSNYANRRKDEGE